ncbi:MAG: carboxypeptidase-like regulatory domain-containing protein, partial [Flavobacteriales bacterium]|nr:carboxypeptidase-like regulatory domain-containing protein [Flavobacteriales bacterium]
MRPMLLVRCRVLFIGNGMEMQIRFHVLTPILCSATLLMAQPDAITGQVKGVFPEGTSTVPGAAVGWSGTTTSTTTDREGRFTLIAPPSWPAQLVTAFVGFSNDTLQLNAPGPSPVIITLRSSVELGAVQIVDRQAGTRLDQRAVISTEIIGQKELKRAACCDLSE